MMEKYYLCGLRDDMYRDEKGSHIKGAVAYEPMAIHILLCPNIIKPMLPAAMPGRMCRLKTWAWISIR